MCTLLPCSTVLFSAVNVCVFYEQINDDDDYHHHDNGDDEGDEGQED